MRTVADRKGGWGTLKKGRMKYDFLHPGVPIWDRGCFCPLANDGYSWSKGCRCALRRSFSERECCFINDKKWVYFEHAFELFHQFSYISECITLKCLLLLRRRFPSPRTLPLPVRSVTPLWLELKCS